MNRRNFLRGTVGLATSSVVGPAPAAPLLPAAFYDACAAITADDIFRAERLLAAQNVPGKYALVVHRDVADEIALDASIHERSYRVWLTARELLAYERRRRAMGKDANTDAANLLTRALALEP